MKNKILSLALAALLGLPVLGMDALPGGDLPGDGVAPVLGMEGGLPDDGSVSAVLPATLGRVVEEDGAVSEDDEVPNLVPASPPAAPAPAPAPTNVPNLITFLNGPARGLLNGITRDNYRALQASLTSFFRDAFDNSRISDPCHCVNCAATRGPASGSSPSRSEVPAASAFSGSSMEGLRGAFQSPEMRRGGIFSGDAPTPPGAASRIRLPDGSYASAAPVGASSSPFGSRPGPFAGLGGNVPIEHLVAMIVLREMREKIRNSGEGASGPGAAAETEEPNEDAEGDEAGVAEGGTAPAANRENGRGGPSGCTPQ